MADKSSQFISVIGYGRSPRKSAPRWSCISGITREAARMPGACNHICLRAEPVIIYGTSPVEAGKLAIERADQAFDHCKRRRRLRRDGWALLAGVVSYPVAREDVENDPAAKEDYCRWRTMTLQWLNGQFGDHLKSVVEHSDETQLHLHFYVVPELLPDGHLDMRDIHPGLRMKHAAAEAGASKKHQDQAYCSGMSRWQDGYWWEVSRNFAHDRFGPGRMRVSRRQRLMEKQMEEEAARQQAARDAEREQFECEMARRRVDLDREHAQRMAEADERGQLSAKAIANLVVAFRLAKRRVVDERTRRQATEAEVEHLRARVAELEQYASSAFVA